MQIMKLTKENKEETFNFLSEKFNQGFISQHGWNIEFSEQVQEEIKKAGYETFSFSGAIVTQKNEDKLFKFSGEKSMLFIIKFGDDEGECLLYEDDEILVINKNTIVIQQKSIALLQVLEKENLTKVYHFE